jgi:hypothetical protein
MGWTGLTGTERRPLDALPALTNVLNQRSIQDARIRNRSKLSPEGHQALRGKLNSSGRVAPKDTNTTKSNLCSIKKKWVRYGDYRRMSAFRLHSSNSGKQILQIYKSRGLAWSNAEMQQGRHDVIPPLHL